mgnify:CR=1 FL=1
MKFVSWVIVFILDWVLKFHFLSEKFGRILQTPKSANEKFGRILQTPKSADD